MNQGLVFSIFKGLDDPLPELGWDNNPSDLSFVINRELDTLGDFVGCHMGSFEPQVTIWHHDSTYEYAILNDCHLVVLIIWQETR